MLEETTQQQELFSFFQLTRQRTETICQPLINEDYVIQSTEDVSPPKWHLAHTTWFFETFILIPYLADYVVFNKLFGYLFNSYYQSVNLPYPRAQRGLLSRPSVANIYAYRHHVNEHIKILLDKISAEDVSKVENLLVLGLNHEQQHQELLLMDIKHNFFIDPSLPVYQARKSSIHSGKNEDLTFCHVEAGMVEMGHSGENFCFDNELPRHHCFLKPYFLANRLITNGEYLEFIAAQGYQQPQWWLADGWDCIQKNCWQAPLYWKKIDNDWFIFTLQGLQKLNPMEPVCHISYYEADAYARWRGYRLPTESEWEHAAHLYFSSGNYLENNLLHPQIAINTLSSLPQQLYGDLWEWTASSYAPYPGFKPLLGALGEYNGKFMSNQMVLRGGSCISPEKHLRATYRNFFQPDKRWQFSGIRLAYDI